MELIELNGRTHVEPEELTTVPALCLQDVEDESEYGHLRWLGEGGVPTDEILSPVATRAILRQILEVRELRKRLDDAPFQVRKEFVRVEVPVPSPEGCVKTAVVAHHLTPDEFVELVERLSVAFLGVK